MTKENSKVGSARVLTLVPSYSQRKNMPTMCSDGSGAYTPPSEPAVTVATKAVAKAA